MQVQSTIWCSFLQNETGVPQGFTSYAVELAVIRPGGEPASQVGGNVLDDLLLDHSQC